MSTSSSTTTTPLAPPAPPARSRPDSPSRASDAGRLLRWLAPLLALGLAAVAFLVLRHELRAHSYHEIARLVRALPTARLLAAVGLTALGYLALTGYDALALEYARHRLPAPRVLLSSFIAYAFSQNAGFAALTGASIRFRFWSAWGLSAPAIAQGVAFTTVTFWLGILTIGGAVLAGAPSAAALLPWMSPLLLRVTGLLLLGLVLAYLSWAVLVPKRLTVRGWVFEAPSPRLALAQVAISTADWLLAGAVLAALLPAAPGLSLPRILAVFLVAQIVALVSHVPGGVGVFETLVVVLLKPYLPPATLAAALVAYRAVYYLLPLGVALVALAAYELLARRAHVARAVRVVGRWVPLAAPYLLAVVTFGAGVVLLLSGATPGVHDRLRQLHGVFPLGVIELSHFAGSVAGVVLILLARGLAQRLDAAWHVAVGALVIGIAASLLKGADYEEALVLAIVLTALVPARPHFWRRAALLSEPLTAGWTTAVLLAIGASVWLGFFSFKHVAYSHDLWWHFALRGDAPRFLRSTVGVAVVVIGYAFTRLVRPARRTVEAPSAEELARIRPIVERSVRSESNLALLGDKALILDEGGEGFLMYGISGRSWVALGDPIGPAEVRRELAWRFRELAVRHGGRPVFYEVTREHLPLYIDLGLTLLKLGEEARVPLEGFTLDVPERKKLRQTVRQAERAGLSFEMLPPEETAAVMPELRRVSDAWLSHKRTREKGFSLGRFDEGYLSHFPIALVRSEGRIVAFANVWNTGAREELSVDLMRYLPDSHAGLMDFLFAHLMLWGAAQGYQWFNLGMAPLSGFEARALAPVWTRIGALVFAHGEHFYNFQGLRRYKEKFRPRWEPRYLAAPGGLALPGVLTNVAALVSGGLTGVIAR